MKKISLLIICLELAMNLLAQKTIDEGRLIAGPHVTGIAIGDAMNNSKTKTISEV